VGRLALAELHAGQADQALVDLRAVVVVVGELLQSYHVEDAAGTCQEAAGALAGVAAGTTTTATAAAACRPLVETFETLLRVATLRRLRAAQDAARRAVA
jgi:hypothetical protein